MMSFDPIKMDLKIKNIIDNSKYDDKKEEIIQTRKVTIGDKANTLKVIIVDVLEDHPLRDLDIDSDINLDTSIVLKIGSRFQKRIDEGF